MIDEEKKENLKKSTLLMYENTIKEMKERGNDTTEIEREYEETKIAFENNESNDILDKIEAINRKNYQYDGYKGNVINISGTFPDFSCLLMQNLYVVRFFGIPEYLVRKVFFDDNDIMRIGFYESNSFCVYEYLEKGKKALKGTFSIEYLDKTGALLRVDTYELKSIKKIKQFPLDYASNVPVYLEVELKYKNHGITTK